MKEYALRFEGFRKFGRQSPRRQRGQGFKQLLQNLRVGAIQTRPAPLGLRAALDIGLSLCVQRRQFGNRSCFRRAHKLALMAAEIMAETSSRPSRGRARRDDDGRCDVKGDGKNA